MSPPTPIVRLPHAALLCAAALLCGCAGLPLRRMAAPASLGGPVEAISEASAAAALAVASASLALLELDPTVSRTLARTTGPVSSAAGDRTLVVATDHSAPGPATATGERWQVPVRAPRVTSRFGPRIDPITGERGRMHRGIDFGAATGEPVYVTASGVVLLGGYCDGGTGNCVVVEHAAGWRSQYFHLSSVSVRPGAHVQQGDRIGAVGSTGRSTGPHLHFQLGRDGVATDPEPLFGTSVE